MKIGGNGADALEKAVFECDSMDLSGKLHVREALDRIALLSDAASATARRLHMVSMKSVI
jgi:hypothetical protein